MTYIFNSLQSEKEIYAQDDFVSFAKSILHLPIFQSVTTGKKIRKEIIIDRFYGFHNVEMRFYPLSVNFDFDVFYYLLKMKLKSDRLTFTINLNHFMKFHKVHPSNKKVYIEKIHKSLENMLDFYLAFSYGPKTYKCHLLTHVEENKENREEIKITFSKFFEQFYEYDANLIFNICLSDYKKIKSDYAKILFMFYTTNQFNNSTFKMNEILKRLQAENFGRQDVVKKINKAHKELIDLKFLKSVETVKPEKEIEGYKVTFTKRREGFLPTVAEKPKSNTDESSICDEELPF
ncbi:hypothetical protein [Pseudomonas aeruginosa]|nr:hypothetical protein [Pseudomonas aeruginosa]